MPVPGLKCCRKRFTSRKALLQVGSKRGCQWMPSGCIQGSPKRFSRPPVAACLPIFCGRCCAMAHFYGKISVYSNWVHVAPSASSTVRRTAFCAGCHHHRFFGRITPLSRSQSCPFCFPDRPFSCHGPQPREAAEILSDFSPLVHSLRLSSLCSRSQKGGHSAFDLKIARERPPYAVQPVGSNLGFAPLSV